MKKVKKRPQPSSLALFKKSFPKGSWKDFRDNNMGLDYKELKQAIFGDQGLLCAYCETAISESELQRIEHFHEKSDMANQHINWALDWDNLIGVCMGGSGRDNVNGDVKRNYPTPKNLSCDASKAHMVDNKKLSVGCEGLIINPISLCASPCLFTLKKGTGELVPDSDICTKIKLENNKYSTVDEFVRQTIKFLNLNCDRLKDQRLTVIHDYERSIKIARNRNNTAIRHQLAQQWFGGNCWPAFFTTKRLLLNSHAELYLQQIQYDG